MRKGGQDLHYSAAGMVENTFGTLFQSHTAVHLQFANCNVEYFFSWN